MIKARYGNLFDMYAKITDEDPYAGADADLPGHPLHDGRTVGRLQPDEQRARDCTSSGEANFSDHGANRLGASALMQGLPTATSSSLTRSRTTSAAPSSRPCPPITTPSGKRSTPCRRGSTRCSASREPKRRGSSTAASASCCGTTSAWRATTQGLTHALAEIPKLRDQFWQNLSVPGEANNLNKNLEYAGRVADYLEFAEVLALDALQRTESCGGHFREESQTPEGEALRDDANFSYAAAWEFTGVGVTARRCTRSR